MKVWVRMAASIIGGLVFIGDVTADRSCRINCEVYGATLSDQI